MGVWEQENGNGGMGTENGQMELDMRENNDMEWKWMEPENWNGTLEWECAHMESEYGNLTVLATPTPPE